MHILSNHIHLEVLQSRVNRTIVGRGEEEEYLCSIRLHPFKRTPAPCLPKAKSIVVVQSALLFVAQNVLVMQYKCNRNNSRLVYRSKNILRVS